MRRILALAFMAVPAILFAQDDTFAGTRRSLLPKAAAAAPSFGGWEIAQLIVALAIVGAILKWGLPWLLRKGGSLRSSTGSIQIKETTTIGTSQIHIVEVAGKSLLIGTSPTAVSFLTHLDATAPASEPAPSPRAKSEIQMPREEDKAFFEILDEKVVTPTPSETKESEDELSLEAAMALLRNAKKRTGLNPEKDAPTRAVISAPSDDDILARLERIAKLTK